MEKKLINLILPYTDMAGCIKFLYFLYNFVETLFCFRPKQKQLFFFPVRK